MITRSFVPHCDSFLESACFLSVNEINAAIDPYYELPTNTCIAECASMMHVVESIEPKIDFGWQTVFFEALQDGNEEGMVNAIGNIDDSEQLEIAVLLFADWRSYQDEIIVLSAVC